MSKTVMYTGVAACRIAGLAMVTLGFVGGHALAEGPGGHESDQGVLIFGAEDPTMEGVSISYDVDPANTKKGYSHFTIDAGGSLQILQGKQTITLTKANANSLQLTLVGFRPAAGSPTVTLVVEDAQLHQNIYSVYGATAPSSTWEYIVSVVDGTQRSPLCSGQNRALAVPGTWTAGQLSSQEPNAFSFACLPSAMPDLDPSPMPAVGTLHPIRPVKAPLGHPTSVAPVNPTPSNIAPTPSAHQPPLTPTPSAHQPPLTHLPGRDVLDGRVMVPLSWAGGVAAKCIDYGYAPWVGGVPNLPSASVSVARAFHNMCVHAMTADYTGKGVPHTIPGTAISIFDISDLPLAVCNSNNPQTQHCVNQTAPAPGLAIARRLTRNDAVTMIRSNSTFKVAAATSQDLEFESIWVTDQQNGGARAFCLAKARWLSINWPDSEIMDLMNPRNSPGPAIHPGPAIRPTFMMPPLSGPAIYCEEKSLSELLTLSQAGPLLVVYSAINETGLWRFPSLSPLEPAGSPKVPPESWITTSNVKPYSNAVDGSGIDIGDGLPCPKHPCKGTFEGYVVSPLPSSVNVMGATRLRLYTNGHGQFLTATSAPPPGYLPISNGAESAAPDLALQGYVFLPTSNPDPTSKLTPTRSLRVFTTIEGGKPGAAFCTTSSSSCDGYSSVFESDLLLWNGIPAVNLPPMVNTHLFAIPLLNTPLLNTPGDPLEWQKVEESIRAQRGIPESIPSPIQQQAPAANLQHLQ